MIKVYEVNYNNKKYYFEYSFCGFKAIQKMAQNENTTLYFKVVEVEKNKNLIILTLENEEITKI